MTVHNDIGVWSRLLAACLGAVEMGLGVWAIVMGSRLFAPAAFMGSYRSTGEAYISVGSLYLGSGLCTICVGLFPRSKLIAAMSAVGSVVCFIAALALLGLSFGEGWNTTARDIAMVHWGLTLGGLLVNPLKLPVYFHLHM